MSFEVFDDQTGIRCWYLDLWCKHIHREDGPAVIYPDGTQKWFLNGKPHRTDGPAVILADGTQEWWLDGKEVDPIVHFVQSKEVAAYD